MKGEMFTTFYTVYMLISFIFCCNINLKVISILECLLQTQIHGKKIYMYRQKYQKENTMLHSNRNHWKICLDYISPEQVYYDWGK